MALLFFSSILIITVIFAALSYIHHRKWHTYLHFDTTKSFLYCYKYFNNLYNLYILNIDKIVTVVVCLSLICGIMNLVGYFLGMLGNNLICMIM